MPRPGLVRRIFRGGEDPLALSFPIGRVGPLRLRIHWIVPVYIASELVASLPKDRLGLEFIAIAMGCLLALDHPFDQRLPIGSHGVPPASEPLPMTLPPVS